MSKKTDLFLFTAEFPFGKGETFLENELPILSGHFATIYLIPYSAKGIVRKVPSNVTILSKVSPSEIRMSFREVMQISRILLSEFQSANDKKFFLKNILQWASYLKKALAESKQFHNYFSRSNSPYSAYSFWMDDWALALASYRKFIDCKFNFTFRSAGFDIWDERWPGNYLPFRKFIYSQTKRVFPNSKTAERYIKGKKIFPGKIQVSYWGTQDHGTNDLNESREFTIVSCSNVIPLKRVELIPEILKNLKDKIRWVHFGDGESMNSLGTLIKRLPQNISVELKGRVSNEAVNTFYKENSVNLFITTSSTEGLPVSIQEAISFGIPVIATAVGGIPEIVNDQTGILIPKDFDPKNVAEIIEKMSKVDQRELRASARKFWKQNFMAESVYSEFAETIKGYSNPPFS